MIRLWVFLTLILATFTVTPTENHPRTRLSLEKMLEERDALIAGLQKRVEALEQRGEVTPATMDQQSGMKRAPPPVGTSTSPSQGQSEAVNGKNSNTVASSRRGPRPQSRKADNSASPEEEEAQRALERTLVISGALLVPYGQAEVQPGFNYLRYSGQGSSLVAQKGTTYLASQNSHNDTYLGSSFLRLGLPFESQLEAYIPYESINRRDTTVLGGNIYSSTARSVDGFGDIRLGVAKTLLTEKNWWPDIIARVTWSADTGRTPYLIPIGAGYNALIGSVTVTKRQDPLVFFGTASYQAAFTKDNRSPGDILGFTIGTILAASPDTSLRFFLNQNFLSDAQYYGKYIHGTSTNISTLNIGASTILGKGFFLDFTSGMGLTTASPDYVVGVSFAYRFDLPFLPPL